MRAPSPECEIPQWPELAFRDSSFCALVRLELLEAQRPADVICQMPVWITSYVSTIHHQNKSRTINCSRRDGSVFVTFAKVLRRDGAGVAPSP
jgi:hypothetical protein